MKIIFFGTSEVAVPVLEALRKEQNVLAVVTQPDAKIGRKQSLQESPIAVCAKGFQAPVLKPEKIKNNPEFFKILQGFSADVFVVVSYGKILPLEIINLPKFKTVNAHFSALPKYRGASPLQAALLNGDSQTAVSIFVLDEKVDHGPVLAVKTVEIGPDETYPELLKKLALKSAEIITQTLEDYISGKITPLPQKEQEASYTKILNKADGKINWHEPAEKIYNRFRAFYPWPGIWTIWNGKTLKITGCSPYQPLSPDNGGKPGTVLNGGGVVCGEHTFLQIKTLQLEGKKEMPVPDFLNGQKQFIGGLLG